MGSAPRRRTNGLYPQQAVQRSPSPRAQVLLAKMRIAVAIGLLGVLPAAYLMILRTDGHVSGQMVVTQAVGLGLLSVIALVLLTTIAVSVLQIRDSRAGCIRCNNRLPDGIQESTSIWLYPPELGFFPSSGDQLTGKAPILQLCRA
jgi:hypothetical protein